MPVKEDLIALFATERNGVRLLSALGKALATYLVDVVGVEDVEEVLRTSATANAHPRLAQQPASFHSASSMEPST